ncbi:MAG: response regulator [Bacteroidota bacterium]
MRTINCIVIEDEPAAQSILEHNISMCPGLLCSGIFPDAFTAQAFLDKNSVDLMFLDINLPEMSGVSFLKSLVHPPLVNLHKIDHLEGNLLYIGTHKLFVSEPYKQVLLDQLFNQQP